MSPILLEEIQGTELLEYNVDVVQRTITYVQPAQKVFHSANRVSTTKAFVSGILARLILTNVRPSSLQISQIQDLSDGHFLPTRQQSIDTRNQSSQYQSVQSCHPHIDVRELFRYMQKCEAV